MFRKISVTAIVMITVALSACFSEEPKTAVPEKPRETVRFMPIGDSYTIGTGVEPAQAWPTILAQHLSNEGIPTILVANPAVSGWTTQAAIEGELPHFDIEGPNFSTLLIGANDLVNGFGNDAFRDRFSRLVDGILVHLPGPDRLVVITIPDFSVTPVGKVYGRGYDVRQRIEEYNEIIKEESEERGLTVIDLYPSSQKMTAGSGLLSEDGLHPSAEGHQEWERIIFETVSEVLK